MVNLDTMPSTLIVPVGAGSGQGTKVRQKHESRSTEAKPQSGYV